VIYSRVATVTHTQGPVAATRGAPRRGRCLRQKSSPPGHPDRKSSPWRRSLAALPFEPPLYARLDLIRAGGRDACVAGIPSSPNRRCSSPTPPAPPPALPKRSGAGWRCPRAPPARPEGRAEDGRDLFRPACILGNRHGHFSRRSRSPRNGCGRAQASDAVAQGAALYSALAQPVYTLLRRLVLRRRSRGAAAGGLPGGAAQPRRVPGVPAPFAGWVRSIAAARRVMHLRSPWHGQLLPEDARGARTRSGCSAGRGRGRGRGLGERSGARVNELPDLSRSIVWLHRCRKAIPTPRSPGSMAATRQLFQVAARAGACSAARGARTRDRRAGMHARLEDLISLRIASPLMPASDPTWRPARNARSGPAPGRRVREELKSAPGLCSAGTVGGHRGAAGRRVRAHAAAALDATGRHRQHPGARAGAGLLASRSCGLPRPSLGQRGRAGPLQSLSSVRSAGKRPCGSFRSGQPSSRRELGGHRCLAVAHTAPGPELTSDAAGASDPDRLQALWSQRVNLLNSLFGVRYAEAVAPPLPCHL